LLLHCLVPGKQLLLLGLFQTHVSDDGVAQGVADVLAEFVIRILPKRVRGVAVHIVRALTAVVNVPVLVVLEQLLLVLGDQVADHSLGLPQLLQNCGHLQFVAESILALCQDAPSFETKFVLQTRFETAEILRQERVQNKPEGREFNFSEFVFQLLEIDLDFL
jgi:hypothetical protein